MLMQQPCVARPTAQPQTTPRYTAMGYSSPSAPKVQAAGPAGTNLLQGNRVKQATSPGYQPATFYDGRRNSSPLPAQQAQLSPVSPTPYAAAPSPVKRLQAQVPVKPAQQSPCYAAAPSPVRRLQAQTSVKGVPIQQCGVAGVTYVNGTALQPQAPAVVQPVYPVGYPQSNFQVATQIPTQTQPAPTTKDVNNLLVILNNRQVLSQFAKKMFRQADTDGNGVLSLDELDKLLPQFHESLCMNLSVHEPGDKMVRQRMRKFDRNGDGVLGVAEFEELCYWTLWRKYEQVAPPMLSRKSLVGEATQGVPSMFYDVLQHLGAGQFGTVNMVKHKKLQTNRVMKTINIAKAEQAGSPLNLLHLEIKLLALLDHPHVLRMYEWYHDTANIYLITDVCAGGELMDIVRDYAESGVPVKELVVALVFNQILDAISYCHQKGVMHKDLKLENIMLSKKVTATTPLEDVHAIVIDVGLAELFGAQHDKSQRSSDVAGSLATMAPEVVMGDFGYKCDIWSIGCMLFCLFNKSPQILPDGNGGQIVYGYPFMPEPTAQDPMGVQGLCAAMNRGPPMHLLQGAGPQLQSLIQSMLIVDEKVRPTAAQCMKSQWFSMQTGNDVAFSQQQVEALLKEHEHKRLWRSMTLEAAAQLPVAKVGQLSKAFKAADINRDGCVSKSELVATLTRLGVNQDIAQQAAHAADFNGDGNIEWSEFTARCLPMSKELFAIALQTAFANLDRNFDGTLDRQEIMSLVEKGTIDPKHMPASKTVDEMIAELDADKNGRISFQEFYNYFINADAAF